MTEDTNVVNKRKNVERGKEDLLHGQGEKFLLKQYLKELRTLPGL